MRNKHGRAENSQTNDEAIDPIEDPVSHEEAIAVLAYFYWKARGCPPDSSLEDWFRAEAELCGRLAAAVTP